MLEKLQIVKNRFDEVSDLIIQPDIISDQKQYVQLNKEYKDLNALMKKRELYIMATNHIAEADEILADGSDADMVEMAKMQLDEAKSNIVLLEEEIAMPVANSKRSVDIAATASGKNGSWEFSSVVMPS